MSSIINQIINDQKESREENIAEYNPINNLSILTDTLKNLNPEVTKIINNNNDSMQEETKIQEETYTPKENTYDNILNEIQEHEHAMEIAIKNADELANATKDSIMYYLDIRKPNRNGILFNGVPDVLNASARLLDLSISGRYKLANMKRLRASILKDKIGGTDNKNELNLAVLLAGED